MFEPARSCATPIEDSGRATQLGADAGGTSRSLRRGVFEPARPCATPVEDSGRATQLGADAGGTSRSLRRACSSRQGLAPRPSRTLGVPPSSVLTRMARPGVFGCRSRTETEPLSRGELSHPDPHLVSRPEHPSPWAEGAWGETQGRNPLGGDLPGRDNGDSLAAADMAGRVVGRSTASGEGEDASAQQNGSRRSRSGAVGSTPFQQPSVGRMTHERQKSNSSMFSFVNVNGLPSRMLSPFDLRSCQAGLP